MRLDQTERPSGGPPCPARWRSLLTTASFVRIVPSSTTAAVVGTILRRLHRMGIPVTGWDPAFFPDEERTPADIVNLGYVVKVIEDPDERVVVLAAAWELARRVLIVSARLDWEAADGVASISMVSLSEGLEAALGGVGGV